MNAPVHYTQIPARCAEQLGLPDPDVIGPIDDDGQPCPWPWEPMLFLRTPIGMFHCGYCGTMVIAGLAHPDYSIPDEEEPCVDVMAEYPPSTHEFITRELEVGTRVATAETREAFDS